MKNNLQMLANLTRSRGCDPAESPPVQTALLDTANRLLSLAATLDGIVQVSREKVSLLQILEQIRRYMLQTLLPSARRVTSASSPSGTTAWASRRTALAPEAPVWSWPPRSCGRSSPASGAWRAVPAGRGSPSTFWSSKTKSCADLRLWRRVQEHGRCNPGTAQALPLGCFA